jgi:alpha-N-arabinofuranosidase
MTNQRNLALVASWLVALLAATPAFAASQIASATIHAERPGAEIRPEIFGQFSEHLGSGIYGGIWVGKDSPIPNTDGYRTDVLAALKDLHVPVVRWPGGCFADEYHWRDGVGAERPVTINTNWGGVPESNAFGTHEFLNFAALIGAKAYISGNVGTGTPREMEEWLQYMTSDQDTTLTRLRRANGRDKPWQIAYFAIGNETWGCGGNMRPEYYADLFRRYAAFLKAPPGAKPLIVASGGYDGHPEWTKTLISTVRDNLGAIDFHYYTLPSPKRDWHHKGAATGFPESEWISTLVSALKLDVYLKQNIAIMDKYDPKKKVALFVDEWGNWYDPTPGGNPGFLPQQNTLRDAVTAAASLDIFMAHADRVRMANISQMVNVLQAMILTDGPRMLLTPTYHVFHMYIPFQGATYLPTELKTSRYRFGGFSVPTVSVWAARAKDGSLEYALTNLDPDQAAKVSTRIVGAAPTRVTGIALTGPAMDSHNSFDDSNSVHPEPFTGAELHGDRLEVTLPPKSVVVLTLN